MSLVDHNRHHPRCDAGFLDLGSRLRRCTCHAALTLATDLKMCLRLVLVLHGGRGTNENTGGLNLWVPAQRHPDHHTPALPQAPSPKSLGERPRAALGWSNSTRSIRTPTRCFHHLTPSPHANIRFPSSIIQGAPHETHFNQFAGAPCSHLTASRNVNVRRGRQQCRPARSGGLNLQQHRVVLLLHDHRGSSPGALTG